MDNEHRTAFKVFDSRMCCNSKQIRSSLTWITPPTEIMISCYSRRWRLATGRNWNALVKQFFPQRYWTFQDLWQDNGDPGQAVDVQETDQATVSNTMEHLHASWGKKTSIRHSHTNTLAWSLTYCSSKWGPEVFLTAVHWFLSGKGQGYSCVNKC